MKVIFEKVIAMLIRLISARATCIIIIMLFTFSETQAQSSLTGIWTNDSEGVRLELLSDQSGTYETATKTFSFIGHYILTSYSNAIHYLEFNIQVGSESKTVYAILKEVSPSQIRFISFLSKEVMESADEEVINSGIILTKSDE